MVRKISITLATVAAIIAGLPLTAAAMGMHGGFAMHGGFHPGIAAAHPFGFHEHGFAFRHRPFFRDRLAVFGLGYPYPSYDPCYTRVSTPWGWRWSYICY
jgi:hypothetical protein